MANNKKPGEQVMKEVSMNTHRVSGVPMIELVILALILLTASGAAVLTTFVWPLIHIPSDQAPSQADPGKVVKDFHVAINSNNVDAVMAFFEDSATITDNKSLINGRDQIRNWVLYSKRMTGLNLKMFHSEMDGETFIWLDKAQNGPKGQNRYYTLRWEAVIVEGKIHSLVVLPRYMPDLK